MNSKSENHETSHAGIKKWSYTIVFTTINWATVYLITYLCCLKLIIYILSDLLQMQAQLTNSQTGITELTAWQYSTCESPNLSQQKTQELVSCNCHFRLIKVNDPQSARAEIGLTLCRPSYVRWRCITVDLEIRELLAARPAAVPQSVLCIKSGIEAGLRVGTMASSYRHVGRIIFKWVTICIHRPSLLTAHGRTVCRLCEPNISISYIRIIRWRRHLDTIFVKAT
jgi:hypothetical protein